MILIDDCRVDVKAQYIRTTRLVVRFGCKLHAQQYSQCHGVITVYVLDGFCYIFSSVLIHVHWVDN